MNQDTNIASKLILETSEKIKSYKNEIIELASLLEMRCDNPLENGKYGETDWIHYVYYDSLIKMRLILENNFNYLETFGLISTTRYLFELNLWLSLLKKDKKYSMVYCSILLKNQKKYYEDHLKQLENEISLFNNINKLESEILIKKTKEIMELENEDDRANRFRELSPKITDEIDSIVAQKFCTNFKEAQYNGYGYQAFLLESNIIPQLNSLLSNVEDELSAFNNQLTEDQIGLIQSNKKFNYKRKAKEVGMLEEYEFIYSNTSRLLHATPVSITTNMKNLELEEMVVYLRYIDFSYRNAITLTKDILQK